MKQKPILIVSASQAAKASDTLLQKSLTSIKSNNSIIGRQYKLKIHLNNKRSLSEIYNEYITSSYLKHHDIILFIHDDVYIDDLGCFDKLYNSIFNYDNDIVGLAGSTRATIKKPALWHMMSQKEFHSGHVTHINDTDNTLYTTSFGPYPRRCLLLDGLFLGINLRTVLKSGWSFNENFKFHHYDIASCIDANTAKLKLSTCNIHAVHQSGGLHDYYDTTFQESEKKFLQLYKDNT
jgi:hypothetical protein